ncbi:hypothetical protein GCM10010365_07310 [Streptomyces poonensis]|uniref:Uncharacterized protein n=2 Tax=Streptomyces poonensis TaxID=68255 RepID=A0A918P815_9ACTN|nr:hypothetical protein [Streptomyces poonensis]GGY91435.1 hypothetical protein GCM10010365_07310 [Streptomyces poonensis]
MPTGTGTEAPGAARTGPGRHRKPRPRRLLIALGGLALTAGALGILRLLAPVTPGGDAGEGAAGPKAVGGAGSADDAPQVAANTETTPPADSADPGPGPGSSTRRGSPAGGPARRTAPTPAPAAPVTSSGTASRSLGADVPAPSIDSGGASPAPGATAPTAPARPPAATEPTAPRPAPGGTAPAPAPAPDRPDLCLPVVGVCVELGPAAHRTIPGDTPPRS